MGGGGGGGGGAGQHRRYNGIRIYNVYIVCSTIFVSHSSCRLASTSMISKYIKLLFHTTSNYATVSDSRSYIFESTCISYYGIINICI